MFGFNEKSDGELKNEAYKEGYQSARSEKRDIVDGALDMVKSLVLGGKAGEIHDAKMKGVYQGEDDAYKYGATNSEDEEEDDDDE